MRMVNPFNRYDDFTPRELMEVAGITTAIYNQWLYRGIFTATKEADGPGTASKYSFEDILIVAIIVKLRRVDMRLRRAKMLAADIVGALSGWQRNHNGSFEWPMAYLAFKDSGFNIDIGEDNNHDTVLRLNLRPIINKVCDQIEKMKQVKKGRPSKKQDTGERDIVGGTES